MSGNRQFVDTNILIYAHDVTAGDKHSRARALVEELWDTRQGCLSVQVLQGVLCHHDPEDPQATRSPGHRPDHR
jgi:predicted nucleic acid-binding protein